MATANDQVETETKVYVERDESVETLQEILVHEQLEPVSYDEARALGYELVTFFEVFDLPGKQEEKDNGGSPDAA